MADNNLVVESPKQVILSLKQLSENITEASSFLSNLEKRLDKVVLATPTTGEQDKKSQVKCELAREIDSYCGSVYALTIRIQNLLQSLEI
jgi:hypothetical protein